MLGGVARVRLTKSTPHWVTMAVPNSAGVDVERGVDHGCFLRTVIGHGWGKSVPPTVGITELRSRRVFLLDRDQVAGGQSRDQTCSSARRRRNGSGDTGQHGGQW